MYRCFCLLWRTYFVMKRRPLLQTLCTQQGTGGTDRPSTEHFFLVPQQTQSALCPLTVPPPAHDSQGDPTLAHQTPSALGTRPGGGRAPVAPKTNKPHCDNAVNISRTKRCFFTPKVHPRSYSTGTQVPSSGQSGRSYPLTSI
jgi:hypothetical protein